MGNDWFTALGRRPPEAARAEAMKLLRHFAEAYPDSRLAEASTEDLQRHIDTIANHIEHDRPYKAMEEAQEYLDLMGSYRLLAAISVGHLEPGEVLGEEDTGEDDEPPVEDGYLDLDAVAASAGVSDAE